ncbi:MAG: hypothetical protein ACI4G1_04865 [Ruminococcus sp.]
MATIMALSIVGCSQKDADDTSASSSLTSSTPNDNDTKNSGNKYTLYDDLSNSCEILYDDGENINHIYMSVPAWRDTDTFRLSHTYSDSLDYVFTVAYNNEPEEKYTGDIEDILEDTYDEFTYAIDDYAMGDSLGEYNLTTKEKVTLDCGSEAMKFEGSVTANEYTSDADYYIYGYSFVYDGVTITVGASIFTSDAIDAKKDTLKDMVDRSVKTVRTEI